MLGWWGAAFTAFLALVALLSRPKNAQIAACFVAVFVAALAAWRADAPDLSNGTGDISHGLPSAVVVTEPVQTGSRQHFVVQPQSDQVLPLASRVCVTSGAVPVVRIG